jgi:glycine/D-amino acid oxidase-like deaminating enzyme
VELVFRDAAGHVPGGLFCLLPQDDAVLASDSAGFLQDGAPGFPLGYVSWDIYAQTLAEITALSPGLLALAHQEALSGREAAAFLRQADQSQAQERDWLRRAARDLEPEAAARAYFRRWYHGDLTVYSPRGILNCCRLLLRRALENGN